MVITNVARGSSVGTATLYELDGPGIESRWGARFSTPVQTGPGPTQPPVQWVSGLFPVSKTAGGVLTTIPSSTEVKERVELYFYLPSRPSWTVIGWTVPSPLPVPLRLSQTDYVCMLWTVYLDSCLLCA